MKTNTMLKNKGTEFLLDALLAAAKKRQHEPVPVPSILADAMQIAAEEIDRLRDELESARRHMELAENAWLRETAGNTPKPHTTPDECSVQSKCTQDLLQENARLKEAIRRFAEQDATLSVQGGNVIVEMDATLTAEEREAVEWFSHFGRPQNGPVIGKHAATLRGLLERM